MEMKGRWGLALCHEHLSRVLGIFPMLFFAHFPGEAKDSFGGPRKGFRKEGYGGKGEKQDAQKVDSNWPETDNNIDGQQQGFPFFSPIFSTSFWNFRVFCCILQMAKLLIFPAIAIFLAHLSEGAKTLAIAEKRGENQEILTIINKEKVYIAQWPATGLEA